MKIDIPTWNEVNERKKQLEDTNRTIMQCVVFGGSLNPVEQFVYDNEPAKNSAEWRKALTIALENAFMCETLDR